jgi:hypothetical protein
VFVEDGLVVIVTSYHKGYTCTNVIVPDSGQYRIRVSPAR